jgi:hypothetical protein
LRATPLVTKLSKRYALISEFGASFGVHREPAPELAFGASPDMFEIGAFLSGPTSGWGRSLPIRLVPVSHNVGDAPKADMKFQRNIRRDGPQGDMAASLPPRSSLKADKRL